MSRARALRICDGWLRGMLERACSDIIDSGFGWPPKVAKKRRILNRRGGAWGGGSDRREAHRDGENGASGCSQTRLKPLLQYSAGRPDRCRAAPVDHSASI